MWSSEKTDSHHSTLALEGKLHYMNLQVDASNSINCRLIAEFDKTLYIRKRRLFVQLISIANQSSFIIWLNHSTIIASVEYKVIKQEKSSRSEKVERNAPQAI
jgi:hypothetical protein